METPALTALNNQAVIAKINHEIENKITANLNALGIPTDQKGRERVTIASFTNNPLYREVYLDYNKDKPKRKQKLLFTVTIELSMDHNDELRPRWKVDVKFEQFKIQ